MTDQAEIAELRLRVARLEAENAELRRRSRVVRPIVERPGFISPTMPELDEVRRIVVAACPLIPTNASRRASFDDEFVGSHIGWQEFPV